MLPISTLSQQCESCQVLVLKLDNSTWFTKLPALHLNRCFSPSVPVRSGRALRLGTQQDAVRCCEAAVLLAEMCVNVERFSHICIGQQRLRRPSIKKQQICSPVSPRYLARHLVLRLGTGCFHVLGCTPTFLITAPPC